MNGVDNVNLDVMSPIKPEIARSSSDTWKMFDVTSDVFRKFETGRNRFERWSKYLDKSDESQNEIYMFAKSNPKTTIVLRDSTNGVLRQIRRRSSCGK